MDIVVIRFFSVRKGLTDEWKRGGVTKEVDFAFLTDLMSKTWSGMTTREYKNYKGLTKENLRDNMSDTELVLNMLAEASTRDISRVEKPDGFEESREVAKRGGSVAGAARRALEAETSKPVITSQNAAQLGTLMVDLLGSAADIE